METELVWQAQLDESDVSGLTEREREMLIDALDNLITAVCADFGLFQ